MTRPWSTNARTGRRFCPAPRPRQATRSPRASATTRSRSRSRTGPSRQNGDALLPGHPRVLRRASRDRSAPDTDVPPIWNPEFFGNTMIVNGATWPYLQVEQRRYRFRALNGCQARFLILDFASIPGVRVWLIGNEGGFLRRPVNLTGTNANRLLMSPGRARGPHRGLHARAAGQARASQRRARTSPSGAASRRSTSTRRTRARPGRSWSSASSRDRPGPSTRPQHLRLPAIRADVRR